MPQIHRMPSPMNTSLDGLALRLGVRITSKRVIRVPIAQYASLVELIEQSSLTGRLFLDFSQGTAGYATWEQTA